MADTQTFQPPTQEHKHTLQPEPKPKHLTITQTSLSLPNDTVSESQFTVQTPISQTLALPNDRDFDCPSFSELLEGVIAANESVGFEGQFEMSHQEVLASVTAKATQARAQMELQAASAFHSTKLSPVTQSKLSVPSSMPVTQKSPSAPQDYARMLELDRQNRSYQDKACVREVNLQNSTSHDTKPAHITMKNPTIDGYNWRKYGQKQVKSTESSRSYYKCTYSDCHAKKKVQHCDHSGRVTEIVYKGRHNHDPPQKIRCNRSRSSVSSAGPVVGSGTVNPPVQKRDDSDSFTSRRQLWQESLPTPELVRQNSSGSDGNAGIKVEEENGEEPESMQRMDTPEPTLSPPQQKQPRSSGSDEIAGIEAEEKHGDEPRLKRRMKERGVAYSVPQFKTIKEPKIVVHAAGDVGISCDGYRWRKYGQKIVKGTPHPRSYYRCTSAGCPVRKHVERATDDTAAIIITYEGKHDHDMPVPKKRHGSPSAALLIAAAAAMNNVQLKKTETLPKRRSSNPWSVGMEGDLTCEKALELGGEKALESARTLLSIGIELKPC